jgi:hypothetical protein
MTPERREYERRRRASGKVRGWSAGCIRGNHAKCKGMRHAGDGTMGKVPCQCYCHVHVCPRCKQPTMHGFRKAINDSANLLETQAKQIRKFVECVQ